MDGGAAGSDADQQSNLLKAYLDFYNGNVFYFPCEIPEEIIWSDKLAKMQIESIYSLADGASSEILLELSKLEDAKAKFVFITKKVMGDNRATDILSIHKQYIQRWINLEGDSDFKAIEAIIDAIRGVAGAA